MYQFGKEYIHDMIYDTIKLILCLVYTLNSYCLSTLKKKLAFAIENLVKKNNYGNSVIYVDNNGKG